MEGICNRGKKMFAACLAVILVLLSLSACSKDGKIVSDQKEDGGKGNEIQAMGRYIEKNIELPEGETLRTLIGMDKNPEGKIVLFTEDKSETYAKYSTYTLMEDGKWEKEELQWLNDMKLESQKTLIQITWGADHHLYASYKVGKDMNEILQTRIVTTVDGIKAEEVVIPDLEKKDKNNLFPYVREVMTFADGNLILIDFNKIILYNRNTGEKIYEISSEDGKISVNENSLYHYNTQGNTIDEYSSSGKNVKSTPITIQSPYEAKLQVAEDKSVAIHSNEGIQIKQEGSDVWEVKADSNAGSIGSPKYYCSGFEVGNKGDYYVYYNSMDETAKISHYIYDKDIPLNPETTLTIFALKDNSAIRQAANEFQSVNPNIRIEFNVAASEEGAAVDDDYIRTLNTEILAGKGPDILVLDGLPVESYIEKGVLKDISDTIKSLVDSGDFLPNIAEVYTIDGNIYTVPSRIGLPMAFGDSDLVANAGDVAKLSEYIKQNSNKNIFGTVDQKVLVEFYLNILNDDLFQKDGSIETLKLAQFLENIKDILDSSVLADRENGKYPSTEWRLIEEGNLLYLGNIMGFYQSESCFSVVKQWDASYGSINRSFIPVGKIGVNSGGKNQGIAEQFIQTLFSLDGQTTDYYDGYPVNKKALESYLDIERTFADAYGGSLKGIDGKSYEMSIEWLIKEHRQATIKMCGAVTQEAILDSKLADMVISKSADYFAGKKSLDETVELIVTGTKAYLAE